MANKPKSVQIDMDLFEELLKYFSFFDVYGTQETHDRIRASLEKKLDALVKRQYYTDYKTAPTDAEREQARLKYLRAAGIPEAFVKH